MTRKKLLVAAVVVLLAAAFFFVTRGPASPKPNPPGTFSFAVLGDAPYYLWEEMQYAIVLKELEANDLRLVIQVGDIFWRPCSDRLYRRSLDWFNGLRHPVMFTPGDNEWSDCWEPGSGGYAPLERLTRLREIFFAEPLTSLGRDPVAVQSQATDERFDLYVENARWQTSGYVFATLHLVGGWNGLADFSGRTAANDDAALERTAAAVAWLIQTFEVAREVGARGVVLAFHANPNLEKPASDRYRRTYEPFIETLEQEVERFAKPVLLVNGDHHEYVVDQPLTRRTTGKLLENLTRVQVPGSPLVGWVRVTVTPDAAEPFAFEANVVPRWKYW